jgi:3-deoxy-manno-octulosonate cytidylyltransferase (CMP-KDO synthetase)
MVQGDEPLVEPEMLIEAIVPMLQDPKIDVVNLLGKIKDNNEFNDRNCIKVVCDLNQDALYFSREPIPHTNNNDKNRGGKQVYIIPFRRDFLIEYTKMMPTPLEVIESVDMLRILEHVRKVRMVNTKYENQSVDTPEDLLRVEKLMKASLTRQS